MLDLQTHEVVRALSESYWMEIETVLNYISNSANLEGLDAVEVKRSLASEVQDEMVHAQSLAARIHELGGTVPGSSAFVARQNQLQPSSNAKDVQAVIRGVIVAEEAAIRQYRKLIAMCDGSDYVTQDLCIDALADEERHCREFRGFLVNDVLVNDGI